MVSRTLSLLWLVPASSLALTPLDDTSLSSVNGRDGLTVNLQSPDGIHIDRITWETDQGIANQEALTHFRDLSWEGDGGPVSAASLSKLLQTRHSPTSLWDSLACIPREGSVCPTAGCSMRMVTLPS